MDFLGKSFYVDRIALVRTYDIDIEKHIRIYEPIEIKDFEQYISTPAIRKAISEFYGIVRGLSIDNKITCEESDYIRSWRNKYCHYTGVEEIVSIIDAIDKILEDEVVTVTECIKLQKIVRQYVDSVSVSPITSATQILNGIMKGIIIDGEIATEEREHLREATEKV